MKNTYVLHVSDSDPYSYGSLKWKAPHRNVYHAKLPFHWSHKENLQHIKILCC